MTGRNRFDVTDEAGCVVRLSGPGAVAAAAAILARLPYPTRLAIKCALDVQDHLPTDQQEDRATAQLRSALVLAGVPR